MPVHAFTGRGGRWAVAMLTVVDVRRAVGGAVGGENETQRTRGD